MCSGVGFIPRKNSGHYKKIFRIAEKGSFWVWSQAVMRNFSAQLSPSDISDEN